MDIDNEFSCLLGSSVQPSQFRAPDGKIITLGDVVCEAFKRSGMTLCEWNKFAVDNSDEEEALLQAVVNEWGLVEYNGS